MSDRFYANVRALSRPFLATLFRLRVTGTENVPRQGPCLVVANHASYLDPAVLGRACPRKVHFLIRQPVYECFGLRWFFSRMDAISVSYNGNDTSALRGGLRQLRAGRLVGVFPEGGRSLDGELAAAKMGAALLATRGGCPVVPAGIRGAHRAMPVGSFVPRPYRIEVAFGKPFVPEGREGVDRKQHLDGVITRIMAEISALLPGDTAAGAEAHA